MKQRTKELAKQAGFRVEIQCGMWCAHPEELERFAELIRLDETKACAEHYLEIMRDAVEQAVLKERDKCAQDYLQDCADAVEAARFEEREANIKIIKRLRPEIVGTPNDPKTHQQWCESAALFSNFESIIAAIRQRGDSK